MLEKDLLQKILNETKDYSNDPVLILSGLNWHEGIIGIVAARLKDKFNKPVIIISINKNIGKASARSIVGFDVGSVIIAATQEKILLKGGGHKMAGGFSINKENNCLKVSSLIWSTDTELPLHHGTRVES
jgi:single-stranded-DNA-specific exonuclease